MKLSSRVALALARRLPRGYWRLTRAAAERDRALWDLPLELRLLPGQLIRADLRQSVYVQLLRHGCFPHQLGEDLLVRRLLRQGDTAIDVGANVGYPTILFAAAVGRTGQVIALEPGPLTFSLLQRTAQAWSNVSCIQVAASNSEGETRFFEREDLDISSLRPDPTARSVSVPTTTVDHLFRQYGRPQFVKIDVEGFEHLVLEGMSQLLADASPPIILFEALDAPSLTQSTQVIGRHARTPFEISRVRSDGGLTALGDTCGTNNYLAMPLCHRSRL